MNLHTNKLASAIKQISITMDNLLSLFRMHNDEKQKISIVTSLFRVKKTKTTKTNPNTDGDLLLMTDYIFLTFLFFMAFI